MSDSSLRFLCVLCAVASAKGAVWWSDPCDTTISTGHDFTCVITRPPDAALGSFPIGGPVRCFGNNEYHNVVADTPEGDFVQISCGDSHCCGVQLDASVKCWGMERARILHPEKGVFVQVTSGRDMNCGVTNDGKLLCWGANSARAGGLHAMEPQGSFVQVHAAVAHACGIRANKTLTCWGAKTHFFGFSKDPPPSVSFRQVSTGETLTCGVELESGRARCWGRHHHGELEPPEDQCLQVSTGKDHACGIFKKTPDAPPEVQCWGGRHMHVRHPGNTTGVLEVSVGYRHSCALMPDKVLCWGDNGHARWIPEHVIPLTWRPQ